MRTSLLRKPGVAAPTTVTLTAAIALAACHDSARPIGPKFDALLRDLRRRLLGKQIMLACVTGCTEAAVSQWETGKRAPNGERLHLIIAALAEAGATADDLEELRRAWQRVKVKSFR